MNQAPAERQPRLAQLIGEQQLACARLQLGQARMTEAELAVAEAQIELSLARLSASVTEAAGGRTILLAGVAQAITEALGSSQAQGAAPRKVIAQWQADAPTGPLYVYALPQSVFYGATLLRRDRLRDLLTKLRFPNPVLVGQPARGELPAGGQFLVWLTKPEEPGLMTERLRDSSRRDALKTRTVDAGTAPPIELRFGLDDLAIDIKGAP